MTKLAEIESAVDALPRPDQETLLQYLTSRLAKNRSENMQSGSGIRQRQHWLEELRNLREHNVTGRTGVSLQQVMDDLRQERA